MQLIPSHVYRISYTEGPPHRQYVGLARFLRASPPEYDEGTLEFDLLDLPGELGYFAGKDVVEHVSGGPEIPIRLSHANRPKKVGFAYIWRLNLSNKLQVARVEADLDGSLVLCSHLEIRSLKSVPEDALFSPPLHLT